MLDSIADLLGASLDIFFAKSSLEAERYSRIKRSVDNWIKANGIKTVYNFVDAKTRSFIFKDGDDNQYEMRIVTRRFGKVVVKTTMKGKKGKSVTKSFKSKFSRLSNSLDESYLQIEKWKAEY